MAERNNSNEKCAGSDSCYSADTIDDGICSTSNAYNNISNHQVGRKKHTNHSESSDIVGDEQFSSYDPSYCSDSCDDNNSVDERNMSINSQNNEISKDNNIIPTTTTTMMATNDKNNDMIKDKSNCNQHHHHKIEKQNNKQIKQKNGQSRKEKILITNNDDHDNSNEKTANQATSSSVTDHSNNVTQFICSCGNKADCLTLKDILKSFNAPISEEQAWALIYQSVKLYRDAYRIDGFQINNLRIPKGVENLNVHKDGTVHITCSRDGQSNTVTSHKKILVKLGTVVYMALDYNLPEDEECIISHELEDLISHMTVEDNDDEGIERDSEDTEGEKDNEPEELEYVIEACAARVKPSVPEDHYKAVCRALVTEALELNVFLQKVFHGDTESLRIKASAETSKQELEKLEFNDWARFWMQVVDELRRGVRLKKSTCTTSRPSVEYELTPYEILMEDIRSRKYNLRKVMVNGDIPPRVKKDAHALILEFIRSRPPLKKASERKLPPPIKTTPTAREQLMDSIRKGRTLRPTPTRLKNRLLPVTQTEIVKKEEAQQYSHTSPRTRQRLIKVDYSLLQDDDCDASGSTSLASNYSSHSNNSSSIQMPSYPTTGFNNENNPNNINTILRRTTYDLATQCESRRASMRRHTIVGCQSNFIETHSVPPSRPDSRQSDVNSSSTATAIITHHHHPSSKQKQKKSLEYQQQKQQHNNMMNNSSNLTTSTNSSSSNLPSMETWTKNSLDENQWAEKISDRLSLTLEEIVHIRSVMTKAELEGLPVGIRIKEDVERRKICFLCLRTRFSIFGPWGIQCKLCQRTVCSKCYTKMRIPTEHFRNVPVVLLSPSLMSTPVSSNTPSPSHHAHNTSGSGNTGQSSLVDESFPKSLMERLLRPESNRKIRNSVGSAPSSPKHQRSTISTPGSQNEGGGNTKMTKSEISNGVLTTAVAITAGNGSYNKENNGTTLINGTSSSSTTTSYNTATNRSISIMSRSMEGPRSLPVQSPARPHSNSSTLDRKNRFARAFTLSSSAHLSDQKENSLRGELMAVCNDCRSLVLEIIRSSRQTRSSARNRALKNLTLDLSPVYKRC